jgi:hypothetical protein
MKGVVGLLRDRQRCSVAEPSDGGFQQRHLGKCIARALQEQHRDPVPQPVTAADGVAELHALVAAA